MRHFLVHTIADLPEGEDLTELREAEVRRSHELQRDGILVALWREVGRLASFGIWRGVDEDDVTAQVASLPLRRFMTVTIAEITEHPISLRPFAFDVDVD